MLMLLWEDAVMVKVNEEIIQALTALVLNRVRVKNTAVGP